MANSPGFWDFMAKRYAKTPIADEAAYQTKVEKTQDYFTPEMRVLEFACGTGSTAIQHAPLVGHYLATDFSSRMLEIAESKRAAENLSNLEFRQVVLGDLSGEEPFDAILGLNILHLLPELDEPLQQVHDLLKPGGVFISSTPCLSEMNGLFFRLILPIGSFLRILPGINRFSRDQLVAGLQKHGLSIEHEWAPEQGGAVFLVARKE